jgi:CheY-like chemotaxis protein
VGLACLLALLTSAAAWGQPQPVKPKKDTQPPPSKPVDSRDLIKPPQTLEEHWDALNDEIEAGKFEVAARHLRGLLALNPTGEQLLEIENKATIRPFLRLRTVPQWSADPKVDQQAREDVQALLKILSDFHADKNRLSLLIKNLTGETEERTFAVRELQRAGANAVPPLVDALGEADDNLRRQILLVLSRPGVLGKEVGPPLIAALDTPKEKVRLDLIDVLRQRTELRAIPSLWYWRAAPKASVAVRDAATQALAYLLQTTPASLPSSAAALTQEADRYYTHQVAFPDAAVTVWRWEGQTLKAATMTASQAEEYYGLRFARQALELDPANEAAQVVFLSLALDKAPESPEVKELLAVVNPGLTTEVLDRALNERRQTVILGALRALGDVGEVRAGRPLGRGEAPLMRALNYPDRRVQMAAAEAVVRIPTLAEGAASARLIEVLRRAAAAEPDGKMAKALVGFFEDFTARDVGQAVAKAGYEVVRVRTGREALRRLNAAADIDVVILDADLPDPGPPWLLGQLRSDINVSRLPIVLVAPPGRMVSWQHFAVQYRADAIPPQPDALFRASNRERDAVERVRQVAEEECLAFLQRFTLPYRPIVVIPAYQAFDAEEMKRAVGDALAQADSPPFTEAERKEQMEKALRLLARLPCQQVPIASIQPAADVILNSLRVANLGNETVMDVIATAGLLPGEKPQRELAAFVLNGQRPVPQRAAASTALVAHIQRYGLSMDPANLNGLKELFVAKDLDPALRGRLALVMGALRPDPVVTGERLIQFRAAEGTSAPKDQAGEK